MRSLGGILPLFFFLFTDPSTVTSKKTPTQIVTNNTLNAPPEYLSNTFDILTANGFSPVTYKVETEDGYILTLIRVIGKGMKGPPVLMIHGLTTDSICFVLRGRDYDLYSLLVDVGYDVWLGNVRGTKTSRQHVSLDPQQTAFWNFSFHELGLYDVPAFVDKVLEESGQDKLFYIGHSLGTTDFLIMNSMRPEYNKKIRAGVLLSPVAYFSDLNDKPNFWRTVRYFKNWRLLKLGERLGITEIFPRSPWLRRLLKVLCKSSIAGNICLDVVGIIVGEHRTNIDRDRAAFIASAVLAGMSLKTIVHTAQAYTSGYLKMFDYGPSENRRRYGFKIPPAYNFSEVTAPVAIYFGHNDVIINSEDALKTAQNLPNVVKLKAVPDPKFTHLDFLVGLNTKQVLYDDIINFLKSM